MDSLRNCIDSLYPFRESHLRVQSLNHCNKVVNFRSGSSEMVSYETALALELCSGEYNVNMISRIIAGTFRFKKKEAMSYVQEVLRKYISGLKFLTAPLSNGVGCDPMRILRIKESRFQPPSMRQALPTELTLSLTYRCNHRCCYCSNSSKAAIPNELSTKDWLRVVDQAADLGVIGITFSGGEPMTHPGFLQIVKRAVKKGIYPTISTNGTFLTETATMKLADAGADFIHLSLAAVETMLYDEIVGCKGHLPLVIKAIQNLKKFGFFIRAKMILMPINIGEVDGLLKLCQSLGVDFVHLAPFRLTHIARGGSELVPSVSDLKFVEALAKNMVENFDGPPEIGTPPTQDLLWENPSEIVKCGGIKSKLTILPNGNVTFCEALGNNPDFLIGSIRQSTLEELWCSDKPDRITQLRPDLLEEPCKHCEYLEICKTGCFMCSLIYSDNPWSVDPRCWKSKIANNVFRKEAIYGN